MAENEGGGAGGGGAGGAGGGGAGGGMVPYERFQAVVAERNELKGKIGDYERQVQGLTEKGATADTLAAKLREAEAAKVAAEGRYESYRAIAGAGITDPDAVEAVEWQYGKLPEKDRPKLGDWLKGLKEKPDTAPALLRSLLAGGGAPGGAGGAGGGKPNAPAGGAGGGDTAGGAEVTPEMIRAAADKGKKTGNWSEYKALRERMGGSKK